MKTTALNLTILDDHTVMVGPLRTYLKEKFGERVNISTFFDAEKCMRNIDEHSHVIILNYFLNNGDRREGSGLGNFNYIKRAHPKMDVTMITSDKDIVASTEEFQREASEYIIRRERDPDNILRLFDKVIVSPIRRQVLSPIGKFGAFPLKKVSHYYKEKDYLMVCLIVFVSMGILVLGGLSAWKIFVD